jgi:uncharacterized phage-associated protein
MTDLCQPKEMAKWFINRVDRDAGEALTHLKLQKLLYFAQAYYLANYDEPLFAEDMQAWTHGPVVPSVWHEYKKYSWESIPPGETANVADDIIPYLEAIYTHFGKFDAKELERITHAHDPWRLTRGYRRPEEACSEPISKKLIREFYVNRIEEKKKQSEIRTGG